MLISFLRHPRSGLGAFDAGRFGTNSRNTVQKKIEGPCVQTLSLLAQKARFELALPLPVLLP